MSPSQDPATADLGVPGTASPSGLLAAVLPAPAPGEILAAVLLEWDAIAATGAPIPPDLPRPWEPATCTTPTLRRELAQWLSNYVEWLNDQHTWDPHDQIPPCWPQHPHLVHAIAVLADQRRRASDDPTSSSLEQWNHHTLPAFHERQAHTLRQHCAAGHHRLNLVG